MHRQWAQVPNVSQAAAMVGNLFDPNSFDQECANGWIQFFPFTKLVSSNGTFNNVDIAVYVRMVNPHVNVHDPFKLPTAIDLRTEGVSYPNEVTCIELNEQVVDETGLCLNVFGEEVPSFRGLLKRFWKTFETESIPPDGGIAIGKREAFINSYPPLVPAINAPYDADTVTDLLSYLRPAFMGMRGTMRKRIIMMRWQFEDGDPIVVSLMPPSSIVDSNYITFAAYNSFQYNSVGTAVFMPSINPGVEFSIPFYANVFFIPACQSTLLHTWDPNNTNFDPFAVKNYEVQWFGKADPPDSPMFVELTSCGEDFQLLRFIAAPPFSLGS